MFLRKFPKIIIYIWIQQFYYGRKKIYLWKYFYTVNKQLKNRTYELFKAIIQPIMDNLNTQKFMYGTRVYKQYMLHNSNRPLTMQIIRPK